jgi:chloramphenicol 3-O phosphotransferase
MAHVTPQRPAGHVILLNGTSSSGKGSIAKELLKILDPPHFHFAIDDFNTMRAKEKTATLSGERLAEILSQTRAGFHRAVAGMALAGNQVVMDYVFSEQWRLIDCLQVFDGLRVVFVGVQCELEVLEQREIKRGDREIGLAKSQIEVVHSFGKYDIEVWSDRMTPTESATYIANSLPDVGSETAFDLLRAT